MPGQSGPGSNGNEGVLRIPRASSDCLVTYAGHLLEKGLISQQRYSGHILQPKLTALKTAVILFNS